VSYVSHTLEETSKTHEEMKMTLEKLSLMIGGTRNVSAIEITLTTEPQAKREVKATLEIPAHTTEATKELL